MRFAAAISTLNQPPDQPAPLRLDKHMFEAGQQCHKRLWLDWHEPAEEHPSASRRELSAVGDELRDLARTAFPKGVTIEATDVDAAAIETAALAGREYRHAEFRGIMSLVARWTAAHA